LTPAGIDVAHWISYPGKKPEGFMAHRLMVSMTIAGLVCGYVAMLYAFMRIVVLIDHSYFRSLAM
jgi:hypothetical protein